MTVVTYSSAAGRLLNEIKVLEHSSLPVDVAEPPFKVFEPGAMLDPSENPVLVSPDVKGRRWLEPRGNEGGATAERAKKRRQKRVRGVDWERMERGRREQQWHLKMECNQTITKCVENGGKRVRGEDKSPADVRGISGIMSEYTETEGEIKQREKRMRSTQIWPLFPWPFYTKNITVRGKSMMKRMKWHHLFIWLPLLFSLCPTPASSQVRVAVESQL